jgi:Trk K+ transport system NAD-binding subunit
MRHKKHICLIGPGEFGTELAREMAPARFVFLPGPNLVIKPSDVLVVIGREKDLMGIKDWKKPPVSKET